MADNSQYHFGMDWYEDNRVSSWSALTAWDRDIRFAYFRLGIGLHKDDLKLMNECHEQTAWDLGGYYELWLPNVARDWQLKVLNEQLAKCPWLKLPVSLAFEPQSYLDPKGSKITAWPSVGDLKYIAGQLIEAGRRVNIYTNLSGLDIIRSSRLIDMNAADWWIARSYAFPLWNVEMNISATLGLLQTKYGIQPERVQFFQTVLDHGSSPIGGGQDFDRAVAWDFGEVSPVPPVEHVVDVTVISDDATLAGVMLDSEPVPVDKVMFHVKPIPVEPPPPPPPPANNLYRIKTDVEYQGYSRTSTDEWKNKGPIDPATGKPVGGNPITPATVKLHGDDPVTKFPREAAKLVQDLNEPHGTFGYVTREAAGWSNRGQEWPLKMEPIAFEDNLVEVTRFDGNRAYLRMWHGERDDPAVIHRWTNIDEAGHILGAQNPAATGDGYIVLAYPGEYWIERDRLVKV